MPDQFAQRMGGTVTLRCSRWQDGQAKGDVHVETDILWRKLLLLISTLQRIHSVLAESTFYNVKFR